LVVVSSLWLGYCNLVSAESDPNFPFEIKGSKFLLNGEEVFLNIIGYQPLEPGQQLWEAGKDFDYVIRRSRIRDDLRRWRAYCGGTDPVVVRVYPQPNMDDPNGMPKIFYDDVNDLGFWIIRNIYVSSNYWGPTAIQDAYDQIDRVIAEVNDANAFDVIFAWEIGNEFGVHNGDVAELEEFICLMSSYIKERVREVGGDNVSNWVTWAAGTFHDPLWTWDELPVKPECLDYIGYNTYGYEPERMRDHQTGPTTGTPYQGYLAALKECYPNTPLVIAETGLSDSNSPENTGDHARLHPWYPVYRKGGLTSEQVSEGLADRYWDARLLQGANDPNIVIAGFAIFEWNDEWHKGESDPNEDDGLPEEHFGLGRFKRKPDQTEYQLRYKLQQETIRDLYTLNFDNDVNIIEPLVVDDNSISVDANTWVYVELSEEANTPVRYRWEASRGYIIGDPNSAFDPNELGEPNRVKFYSGNAALGPATVTVVAIDTNGNVDSCSITIDINIPPEPNIEILTVGKGISLSDPEVKASGRVYNANLNEYKLVCYIYNWHFYIQPYDVMKSIWIGSDGYWWTNIRNAKANPGELYCWLVPESWDPQDEVADPNWSPPEYIAEANTVNMDSNDYDDEDNDLLPDWWEIQYFGAIEPNGRYGDPDNDGAHNLEEFLADTSPNNVSDPNKNDTDRDGLWDNWERHFFGDISFYNDSNDPDGDGLTNSEELALGLHPVRVAVDKDQDGLPDLWEMRQFNNLSQNGADNPDFDGCTNLDEYEVGLNPVVRDLAGDFDCQCDVDFYDLGLFVKQWLWPRFSADVAPETPDRTVDFLDWAVFAKAWQSTESSPNWDPSCDIAPGGGDGKVDWYDLAVFVEQWLQFYYADIAPDEGDDVVNFLDFAALAENWLCGCDDPLL
jgi:hypothetical protein